MARLIVTSVIFAVMLSVTLPSHARHGPSDLPDGDPLPTADTPLSLSSSPEISTAVPTVESTAAPFDAVRRRPEAVSIEVSFIPVGRHFPNRRPHDADRHFWLRHLPHRCRQFRRPHRPDLSGGEVISYGNDMLVGDERMGRDSAGEIVGFHHGMMRDGGFFPMRREGFDEVEKMEGKTEISVAELLRNREVGLTGEMRPHFHRGHEAEHHHGHHHGEREEEEGGFVKRFWGFLNPF